MDRARHDAARRETAAFVNVVVTIAKVVPILVFIAIAAVGFKAGLFSADFWGRSTQIDGAPLGDTMTQVKNMMLVTVWVFIGIEGASVYSQRAAKRRNVGRATVLGFAGVLALLLMVNLLSYGLMAQAELAGVPDPSMAGVLENEVGSWGAAFISIGLVVSLLGALIAWVLLCVEILRLPALEHVMPKALAKENAHGAPANALWLTNICVQAMLLWTLANESTYTQPGLLATSLILLPYLWSAAYQVMLAVRGETYESGHGRARDLVIGVVGLVYAVWLVYAGGWQYLLVAAIFYLVGTALYLWARRESRLPAFTKPEWGVARRRGADLRRRRRADGHRQPLSPVNATESRLGVWSEAGRLRRVLVCAPGLAHQRLTPDNCHDLLFDDVIWLQQARRDHFDFVAKMVDRGVEVLELQDLLADVVAKPDAREWLLDRKVTDDLVGPGLTHEIRAWLTELSPDRLAEFLIGGVAYQDVVDEVDSSFLSLFSSLDPAGFVIRPLPNTQFMRDNSAWIFGGVTLNPMFWPARRQETLLTTAVYKFHPAFADEKYEVWLGDADGRPADHGLGTLEGGDVMPIGKGLVVIGMGERSSHQAITQVARNLFAAGAAETGDHRQPAEDPLRDAPGHGVHLLRPRPGDGVRSGRRRDRADQPAARRQLAVRLGRPARTAGPDRNHWRGGRRGLPGRHHRR